MTLESNTTLRLVWPQWQGAGHDVVASLTPGIPLDQARRGYATGAAVLESVLPAADGPTDYVSVSMNESGLALVDGIEAREAVITQLRDAFEVIDKHSPAKILTIGGECSVSVAPFSALASQYEGDLAIIWIDSHPDVGTPDSSYPGYHAMAVSTLLGKGDSEIQSALPATVSAENVALVGLHSWTDDDFPHVEEWGISAFSPDDLRSSTSSLLQWITDTGCSRVAIHLDVDVVDSDEIVLGLGMEPGGLTTEQVRRIVGDISAATEVVALTVAEYIPRQVLAMQRFVDGFPLL